MHSLPHSINSFVRVVGIFYQDVAVCHSMETNFASKYAKVNNTKYYFRVQMMKKVWLPSPFGILVILKYQLPGTIHNFCLMVIQKWQVKLNQTNTMRWKLLVASLTRPPLAVTHIFLQFLNNGMNSTPRDIEYIGHFLVSFP